MPVRQLIKQHYECDRCGVERTFLDHADAASSGWTELEVGNQQKTLVLCPVDAAKHKRFMDGNKTGVGARFNKDEKARWEDSCR